ncbi:hypothetical protein VNI00_018713 [Paramarasmius palmivorus]|uniref:Uncharacterized protein n=1 Tax=Paramarasmius palmivorus TaxID=297713 RepID=A0AAW0AXU1_9AGAR
MAASTASTAPLTPQTSKVDRRQGTHILPSNPYRANVPVDRPGTAPDTYTFTQHNPDKGITIARTTVEEVDGWVVTTTTVIQRRHPDVQVSRVSRGTSPGVAAPTSNVGNGLVETSTSTAPTDQRGSLREAPDIFMSDISSAILSNTVAGVAPPPPQYSSVIPHPNHLFLRPGMETHDKFYIIFRGREVGLFYDYFTEVRERTLGVSRSAFKVYSTFQAAVNAYDQAWNGNLPGHELMAIPGPITQGSSSGTGLFSITVHTDSDSDSEAAEVEEQVQAPGDA